MLAGQRQDGRGGKNSKEGKGWECVNVCVRVRDRDSEKGGSVLCKSGKSIGQWVISGGCV